ncbi:MAG: hypothetical protein ACI90V_012120, partial [Bacillariaceae sp.]
NFVEIIPLLLDDRAVKASAEETATATKTQRENFILFCYYLLLGLL